LRPLEAGAAFFFVRRFEAATTHCRAGFGSLCFYSTWRAGKTSSLPAARPGSIRESPQPQRWPGPHFIFEIEQLELARPAVACRAFIATIGAVRAKPCGHSGAQ